MDFVDRHGLVEDVAIPSRGHPGGVTPFVVAEVRGDRPGSWRKLGGERERIGLGEWRTVLGMDLERVAGARCDGRHESLPEAARAQALQGVYPAVPPVEIAHYRHAAGIRRPDDEVVAVDALAPSRARAHLLPRAQPVPLAEEVRLVVGHDAAGTGGLRIEIHVGRTLSKNAVCSK